MKLKPFVWILLISIFGAILYIQTVSYGYSGDDGIYAYFNRVTQKGMENWTELFQFGSMNFIQINPSNTSIYRPFTLLTFAIEHQIFGEFDAQNGHIFNIVLYFGFLLVVGMLLRDLASKRNLPEWLPLLILLLYAVHPIHTEVVASVKSRDTLLSGLFAFSAILIWVKSQGKISPVKWGLILGLYFLSLLSKEESIPLLALVVLISWFFLKNELGKSIQNALPFLAPLLVYMGLRAVYLDSTSGSTYGSMVNSVMYSATGMDWIATNFYIYLMYLKLLFFPHPLSWDYSFSQIAVQSIGNPLVLLSLGVFGALFYVAWKGFKTRSLYSFGILFYLTSFSIFANLVPSLVIGSNLGERFMFTPSLAFSFLVVYGLYDLGLKLQEGKRLPMALLVILPVCLAFSWKTVDRAKVWESNMTLSASGVETAPNSWRTHIMHAEELRLKGKEIEKTSVDSAKPYFEKAIVHYDRGFEILGPANPVPQYYAPLAEVLIGLGDSTRAIEVLRTSITKAPKIHYGWFKLAYYEFGKGNYEEAKNLYLKSLNAERPDLYATYKNLGNTLMKLNQNLEAVSYFEKAIEQKEDPEINRLLAYLYTEMGILDKAKEYTDDSTSVEETAFLIGMKAGNDAFQRKDYSEAIKNYRKIEKDYERFGGMEKYPSYHAALGKSLIESRDTLAAKKEFLLAMQVTPNDPVVLTNLGVIAFYKDKRYVEAERYFRNAVNSNPEDPFVARLNLGTALLVQRKEREALTVLEESLKFGSNPVVIQNLYLLHTSLGNQERAAYYQGLIK